MWLSLVEHLLWEQGVAGSNPVIPTKKFSFNFGGVNMKCPVCRESKTSFEYIKQGILNKGLLIGLESVKESAFKLSRQRECKCLSCGYTFKY